MDPAFQNIEYHNYDLYRDSYKFILDGNDEEVFDLEPFGALIEEQHQRNLPYVLALIQDVGDIHLFPQDAIRLKNWQRIHQTNPNTQKLIDKVFYYSLIPSLKTKDLHYLGSSNDIGMKEQLVESAIGASLGNLMDLERFLKFTEGFTYTQMNGIEIDVTKLYSPIKAKIIVPLNRIQDKKSSSSFQGIYNQKIESLPHVIGITFNHEFKDPIVFDVNRLKKTDQKIYYFVHAKETSYLMLENQDQVQLFLKVYLDALKGNRESLYKMGCYFEEGKEFVQKNLDKALYWYFKATQKGEKRAQIKIDQVYSELKKMILNEIEKFQFFKAQLEFGYLPALFDLGSCYLHGRGVEINIKEAKSCFEKVVRENPNHLEARDGLFSCYYNEAEYKKAEDVIRVSDRIKADFPEYKFLLGRVILKQIKTNKEIESIKMTPIFVRERHRRIQEMLKYLERSAELGYDDAKYLLSILYTDELYLKINKEKSFKYLSEAAVKSPNAQYQLSLCYENGVYGERNPEKSIEFCKKAALGGLKRAQSHLGMAYLVGEGVPKDIHQAIFWYEKAEAQGCEVSALGLGCLFYYGDEDIVQDQEKGLKSLFKAREFGSFDASYHLGLIYTQDVSVQNDMKRGIEYLKEAAEKFHTGALFLLGNFYENGIYVEKDLVQASIYYTTAAIKGHVESEYHVGSLSEKQGDLYKAIEFYKMSAKKGSLKASEACKRLGIQISFSS